jgi:hypothetical protein
MSKIPFFPVKTLENGLKNSQNATGMCAFLAPDAARGWDFGAPIAYSGGA